MANGSEFIKEIRQMALEKETPNKVSNRALWALAVDALHERKELRGEVNSLKNKASLWGAAAGLLATVGTILVALFLKVI